MEFYALFPCTNFYAPFPRVDKGLSRDLRRFFSPFCRWANVECNVAHMENRENQTLGRHHDCWNPTFQVAVCPNCRLVDCFPMLEENDCPQGTHLVENLTAGGCCPACVKYLLAESKRIYEILLNLQYIETNVVRTPCMLKSI